MTDPAKLVWFFMVERQQGRWRAVFEEPLSRETRATDGERGQNWLRRWVSAARTRLHSHQTEPLRALQAAQGHPTR
jgi:hypothetical protein